MKRAMIVILVLLTSCTSSSLQVRDAPANAVGAYPINYRELMHRHVQQVFLAPHSLRSVAIGPPVAGTIQDKTGWLVCMTASTKNRMEDYTGQETRIYVIRGQQVIGSSTDFYGYCNQVTMEPWPEMEMTGS
jgi:hypothetical protein